MISLLSFSKFEKQSSQTSSTMISEIFSNLLTFFLKFKLNPSLSSLKLLIFLKNSKSFESIEYNNFFSLYILLEIFLIRLLISS